MYFIEINYCEVDGLEYCEQNCGYDTLDGTWCGCYPGFLLHENRRNCTGIVFCSRLLAIQKRKGDLLLVEHHAMEVYLFALIIYL